MKLASLSFLLMTLLAMVSCSSSTAPAGMALIGPFNRAGGMLPPDSRIGRPAVVVGVDGKSHRGPGQIKLAPGVHVIRCLALDLHTLSEVYADLTFTAQPNTVYKTKCRTVGRRVQFEIVDSRSLMQPLASGLNTGAPTGVPRTEMDNLMAPMARIFTDDREEE